MIPRPPLLRALAPVMTSVRLLFSPPPTRAVNCFLFPPSVRSAGNGGVSPTVGEGLAVARLCMRAGVGNGSSVHCGPPPTEEEEEEEFEVGGGDDALVEAELEAVWAVGEECDRRFSNHWENGAHFITHFLATARGHPVLAQRLERFPLLSESYEAMLPAQRREMLEGVVKGVLEMRGGLEQLVGHRDAVRDASFMEPPPPPPPPDGGGGFIRPIQFTYRDPVKIDWKEAQGETQRELRHRMQVDALWGGNGAEEVEEVGEVGEVEEEEEQEQVGEQEVGRERGEGLGLGPHVCAPLGQESSTPGSVRQLQYHTRGKYVLELPLAHAWFLTVRQKAALAEEGVFTLRQLLTHFPRAYLDFSAATAPLQDGQQVALIGQVEAVSVSARGPRHAFSQMQVAVGGGYRISHEKWMNSRWPAAMAGHLRKEFPVGALVCLNGKVSHRGGTAFELKPGEVKRVEEGGEAGDEVVGCVYPAKGAVTPQMFRNALKRVCADLPADMDPLGSILIEGALSLRDAYVGIHGGGAAGRRRRATA